MLQRTNVSVFEVAGERGKLYSSWGGDTHQDEEDTVRISGLFANKQGLHTGEQVLVSAVPDVAVCSQVHVVPVSVDDWEILTESAGAVEAGLLQQVRAVWTGQVLPVWLSHNICVFCTVGMVSPNNKCCLLEERTEVVVAPKLRQPTSQVASVQPVTGQLNHTSPENSQSGVVDPKVQKHDDSLNTNDEKGPSQENKNQDFLSRTFGYVKSLFVGTDSDMEKAKTEPQIEYLDQAKEVCLTLRVQAFGELKKLGDVNDEDVISPLSMITGQPTNVYINQNTFCALCSGIAIENKSSFLASMSRMLSPKEKEDMMKKKMENVSNKDGKKKKVPTATLR